MLSSSVSITEINMNNAGPAHFTISNDGSFKINNTSVNANPYTPGVNLLTIMVDGKVGIGTTGPTEKLNVVGNILATGNISGATITSGSDYRIKEYIKTLNLDEYSVDHLNPVYFKFKDSGKESIGVIAHELQEYYPFLVEGEKDGEKTQSVNYIGLIGVLIKEIQKIKGEVKELKEKLI